MHLARLQLQFAGAVYRTLFSLVCVGLAFPASCGTNTNEPVYPLYSIISPVSVPAIVAIAPVSAPEIANPLRYEFDVKYYVTNREENFIGYNLYISSSTVASNGGYVGISGEPWLVTGVAPSFSHKNNEVSTLSSALITRRIDNYKPAPSPIAFQYCEIYYFRLTAVVYNGLESNASPQVAACAATSSASCPVGTPCNPGS
ncbi:MAG: hypothetical protein KDK39_11230 [Leptospiraceae bacterium]|nr:hypothetical protein [Leptospiraceae bacterium]